LIFREIKKKAIIRMATNLPSQYFNPISSFSASAGKNVNDSYSNVVRDRLSGGRRTKRTKRTKRFRRTRRTKGGFVPSVMGGFVGAVSKYIVPIALFAGYKLMTRKKGKKGKR